MYFGKFKESALCIITDTEMPYFSILFKFSECFYSPDQRWGIVNDISVVAKMFYGTGMNGPMDHIEIYIVRSQSSHGGLTVLNKEPGITIGWAYLGPDQDIVPLHALNGLPQGFLAPPFVIGFR